MSLTSYPSPLRHTPPDALKNTVQEGDDGDAGEGSGRDGSETSLIRAIQAAQEARGGLAVPSTLSARSFATGDAARAWRVDGPPPGSRIGLGLGVSSTAALILALSMAWSALDSALEVLFSLWILIPGEARLEIVYLPFFFEGGREGVEGSKLRAEDDCAFELSRTARRMRA